MPVDIHVGGRLRLRRLLLGYSQQKLAKAVDLTFQQIQKYERGANRISASRLYQFSKVLNVPVSFFFDDMDDSVAGQSTGRGAGGGTFDQAQFSERETVTLIRAYYGIVDPAVRRGIFELIRSTTAKDIATDR